MSGLRRWIGQKLARKLIVAYIFVVFVPIVLLVLVGDYMYREHFAGKISEVSRMALKQLAINIDATYHDIVRMTDFLNADRQLMDLLRGLSRTDGVIRDMDEIRAINAVDAKLAQLMSTSSYYVAQFGFYMQNGLHVRRTEHSNTHLPVLQGAEATALADNLGPGEIRIARGNGVPETADFYRVWMDYRGGGLLAVFRVSVPLSHYYRTMEEWSGTNSKVQLHGRDDELLYDTMPDLFAEDGGDRLLTIREPLAGGWSVTSVTSYDELLAPITRMRRNIMLIGSLLLALSSLLYWAIAIHISRPLSRFVSLHKKVQRGDFSVSYPLRREDEIGLLAQSFNRMVQEMGKLLEREYMAKIKAKDAQLQALQSQIKPHFLYNTLESINMMAVIEGSPRISEMVNRLGRFYRLLMSAHRGKEEVRLEEELEMARLYVALQLVRFGTRMKADWQIDPRLHEARVPKLLLQPIIENAIYHGLEKKLGDGELTIGAALGSAAAVGAAVPPDDREEAVAPPPDAAPDCLVLTVRDNGVGIPRDTLAALQRQLGLAQPERGESIGVCNVHERIRLLYGRPYGVWVESSRQEGTVVRIALPYLFGEGQG